MKDRTRIAKKNSEKQDRERPRGRQQKKTVRIERKGNNNNKQHEA